MESESGVYSSPTPAALAPEKFQDFTLINPRHLQSAKIVGCGGFGEVYQAFHRMWMIPVAIKYMTMNRSCSGKHELLEEAKKMHKAQFEYVVRLYGVTERHFENGIKSLGLVTEFMENGSLNNLLRQHQIPWPLRLRFAYEIALGMNFLHNLQPALFHHDLKPANILLSKDYRVKICDFGMAKWRKFTGQYSSQCSRNGGTLSYIPPECLKDINARKDVKFDVYSYGIVIWEILTCQTPYQNAVNSQHMRMRVDDGDRPDLGDIPPDRPESSDVLIQLMKKCWHQNPDARPTFSMCVHDLEPNQSSEQELRSAIQTLTSQESPCVVVDGPLRSPGESESSNVLCEPVEEQNRHNNLIVCVHDLESNQSSEQELRSAIQTLTSQESPCVVVDEPLKSPGESESSNVLCEPVEEQNRHNNLIEPVQETNRKKCMPEAAQNVSQEKIVTSPLAMVTLDECLELAKLLTKDWKGLARYLGLTQSDIDVIDHDYERDGLLEKAYQMLLSWRQQRGKDANRQTVVLGLKKIKRKDLWMMFCS
uniref:receptor-interacting serine/threonine-protein kinase 2-like n=1 Tax=Pristiophorus japonicus TaxID=55135 RepID=UPI00398EDF82